MTLAFLLALPVLLSRLLPEGRTKFDKTFEILRLEIFTYIRIYGIITPIIMVSYREVGIDFHLHVKLKLGWLGVVVQTNCPKSMSELKNISADRVIIKACYNVTLICLIISRPALC